MLRSHSNIDATVHYEAYATGACAFAGNMLQHQTALIRRCTASLLPLRIIRQERMGVSCDEHHEH